MSKKVLVVDDDPVQRRILDGVIRQLGFEVQSVDGGEAAINILESEAPSSIDIVLLDMIMPDVSGLEVLSKTRLLPNRPPIIVQTANGSIDSAIKAMRAGACDFVVKPISPERLEMALNNATKISVVETKVKKIRKKNIGGFTFDDIITRSDNMKRILEVGERAASSDIPVMIEGESGVGKELIARAIQGSSGRANGPFVTVNCGAIPENLVESILFGHEKGAFTGALAARKGKFLEADGGTLFLDEVGELPLETQVKLLRAIQEGEVEPVGGKKTHKVDIRIISATNQDMIKLVQDSKFRDDLYYRLNVFPLMIPALREREHDVPELVNMFVRRFAAEENKVIKSVDAETMNLLARYPWPGNVRQLENTVYRAVVLADSEILTHLDFPQIVTHVEGFQADEQKMRVGLNESLKETKPEEPVMIGGEDVVPSTVNIESPNGQRVGIQAFNGEGHVRSLKTMEEEMIKLALGRYRGHMTDVAKHLGIGRSTLYRKMQEFGLEMKV